VEEGQDGGKSKTLMHLKTPDSKCVATGFMDKKTCRIRVQLMIQKILDMIKQQCTVLWEFWSTDRHLQQPTQAIG
jgi:hypothetical protein